MYLTIGFWLGCLFSLYVIGESLWIGYKAYMQWVNDEEVKVHPFFDPFLNHNYSWGQDFADFLITGILRGIIITIAPVVFAFLWLPIVVIGGGICAGRYHKYIVRLQKKAGK